jgi:hypothetical protein
MTTVRCQVHQPNPAAAGTNSLYIGRDLINHSLFVNTSVTLSNGLLLVDGVNAGSSVLVASGARLGGNGAIGRSVTFGPLAPWRRTGKTCPSVLIGTLS